MIKFYYQAMLLNSMAKSLLDISPLTFLSESGKYLLEASSILNYISLNINTGKWKNIVVATNTKVIPPELSDKVCNSISLYLKGGAQALSCAKAICIGPSTTLIRSRLCAGVVNSLTSSISDMNLYSCTVPEIQYLIHIHVSKQLFAALAYQYYGQSLVEKTEVGNAIACYLAAKVVCLNDVVTSLYNISAHYPSQVCNLHDVLLHIVGIDDDINQHMLSK